MGRIGAKWKVMSNGYGISFLHDENVKLIVVMIAQLCEYTEKKKPMNYTQYNW